MQEARTRSRTSDGSGTAVAKLAKEILSLLPRFGRLSASVMYFTLVRSTFVKGDGRSISNGISLGPRVAGKSACAN
jgi:hypothetical protein